MFAERRVRASGKDIAEVELGRESYSFHGEADGVRELLSWSSKWLVPMLQL